MAETVICPVCELRPVTKRRGRAGTAWCNPCQAAIRALYRYWERIGMPVSYATPRDRMTLTPIRRAA